MANKIIQKHLLKQLTEKRKCRPAKLRGGVKIQQTVKCARYELEREKSVIVYNLPVPDRDPWQRRRGPERDLQKFSQEFKNSQVASKATRGNLPLL